MPQVHASAPVTLRHTNDTDGNDTDGYDTDGNDTDGYDTDGNDTDGNDTDGYDTDDNDTDGNDTDGNDTDGNDTDGYDTDGNDTDGYDTNDTDGNDTDGYDTDGYDTDGYDNDTDGYDTDGYDTDGNDTDGNDTDGNDTDGNDTDGYDTDGNDTDGYDTDGYDTDGYDTDGYDTDGNDTDGNDTDRNDTDGNDTDGNDTDGYDTDGYDTDGYGNDTDGYDTDGNDTDGYDTDGYGNDTDGNDTDGYDTDGYDTDGYDTVLPKSSGHVDSIWIGLHDVALEVFEIGTKGFRWTSCAIVELSGWTNWDSGGPPNRTAYNSFCIRMSLDQLKWRDETCASSAHFLCEKNEGPCNNFKPETEGGCDVSIDWLKSASNSTTEASSKSECVKQCLSGGPEDGSPLCWVYQFSEHERCVLYLSIRPVVCTSMSASGPSLGYMVRDCFSIKYLTPQHTTPDNNAKPNIDCSAMTTTTVPEKTAIATTETTSTTTETTSTTTETTSITTETTSATTETTSTTLETTSTTAVTTSATDPTPTTENTTPDKTTTALPVTSSSPRTSPWPYTPSTMTGRKDATTLPDQYRNSTTNYCACSCRPQTSANVSELIRRLQKELAVNKSTLSSTRRRKESAPDYRPSAQATGGIGIAILVIVVCCIVLPDLRNFASMFSPEPLRGQRHQDEEKGPHEEAEHSEV
ncbi:hypothetical protein ACOMHN_050450 [Nucella lapillus]